MGIVTGISWCDHTHNEWIGCQKVSPACASCYAEVSPPVRLHRSKGLELWGPPKTTARQLTGQKNRNQPLRWDRAARAAGVPARTFCASLADVFEDHPSLPPWRENLWKTVERTEALEWLLLTKRPENIRSMVPDRWLGTPPKNVWYGTTVEDQRRADERIPVLLKVPARVRFLSVEPMLEQIDFSPWLSYNPINVTDEYRRGGVQGGSGGLVRDPFGRVHLADCPEAQIWLDRGRESNPGYPTTDRCVCGGGVPTSKSNGGRETDYNTSTTPGVETLPWPDPGWVDNQPQEWGEDGQSTGQPGTGDVRRTSTTHDRRAWDRTGSEPGRGTELDEETDGSGCEGNPQASKFGGETEKHRPGLRRVLSEHIEDRPQKTLGIHWIICGGESGPGARPFNIGWARDVIAQCRGAGVPVFVKQLGARPELTPGPIAWPITDSHGANLAEWPDDLRVQQFPPVRTL